MLDPNWQSPYAPSASERHANTLAVQIATRARLRPWVIGGAVAFGAGVALAFVGLWPATIVGVLALGAAIFFTESRVRRADDAVGVAGTRVLASLRLIDVPAQSERLGVIVDRLGATFGLSDVTVSLVDDPGYNAALVPDDGGRRLLVTTALAADFDLVEMEGVVAHLMARERLGAVARSAAATLGRLDDARARALAGSAGAYRADEVAAAAIQYPQGLQRALARCAQSTPPASSFLLTPVYAQSRWLWFDRYADRAPAPAGDLDGVGVRARALSEW